MNNKEINILIDYIKENVDIHLIDTKTNYVVGAFYLEELSDKIIKFFNKKYSVKEFIGE